MTSEHNGSTLRAFDRCFQITTVAKKQHGIILDIPQDPHLPPRQGDLDFGVTRMKEVYDTTELKLGNDALARATRISLKAFQCWEAENP
jgi:hypothetical protein